MIRFSALGFVALGLAAPAAAQFRLEDAPSAQRAAAATPAPIKPNLNRIAPLSPLGGPQGMPSTIAPAAPIAPTIAYSGVPAAAAPPPVGASPIPVDPSVDDPSKPRVPLKPKPLAKGVAPRP